MVCHPIGKHQWSKACLMTQHKHGCLHHMLDPMFLAKSIYALLGILVLQLGFLLRAVCCGTLPRFRLAQPGASSNEIDE